jgi:hypothetical protein
MLRLFRSAAITLLILVCASPAPAWAETGQDLDVTLREGRLFTRARRDLLREGWQPAPTNEEMPSGGLYANAFEAAPFYRAGFHEVYSCTQGGYCSFYYRKGDQCLELITEGLYRPGKSPRVVGRRHECYRGP